MYTQIRRWNLLRLLGIYTIRQETSKNNQHYNHLNLSPFGTKQVVHTQIKRRMLLALLETYFIRQETKHSQQNNHLNLSQGWEQMMSTQIRRRNLLRLIGIYIIRGKPTILKKKAIRISMLGRNESRQSISVAAHCCV